MGQTLSSNASTMAPRFSIRELIEPSRLSVSEPTAFSAFFGGLLASAEPGYVAPSGRVGESWDILWDILEIDNR